MQYFRFELMYVEGLRKRAEILGLGSEDLEPNKDEDEILASDSRDVVLGGQIALEVAKSAMNAIPEPEFATSLINIALEFEFIHETEICQTVLE